MTETPFGELRDAPETTTVFDTPDHTKSRSIPPGVKRVVGKMGQNKKARSGVRQLRPDDIQRIEEYYDMFAWAMQMYKPAVSQAILDEVTVKGIDGDEDSTTTRSALCANAWGELAKENDGVRRMILMLVETGAWSKVFMANMPILVAALPDDALSRLMSRFMPTHTDEATSEYAEENAA